MVYHVKIASVTSSGTWFVRCKLSPDPQHLSGLQHSTREWNIDVGGRKINKLQYAAPRRGTEGERLSPVSDKTVCLGCRNPFPSGISLQDFWTVSLFYYNLETCDHHNSWGTRWFSWIHWPWVTSRSDRGKILDFFWAVFKCEGCKVVVVMGSVSACAVLLRALCDLYLKRGDWLLIAGDVNDS